MSSYSVYLIKSVFKLPVLVVVFFLAFSFSSLQSVFASPEIQRCKSNQWCTLGEFLYDDEYTPIATADCVLTGRDPAGSVYLNSVSMTASADGWYAYSLDTTGLTEGLYRTQMCCTSGSDYLCLDKSFVVGASFLSTDEIAESVWNAETASYTLDGSFGNNLQEPSLTASQIWSNPTRTLTGFGTLITDMWNYSTRSLTTFSSLVDDVWSSATRTLTEPTLDSGSLATSSDIDNAVTSIKTAQDHDLGDIIAYVDTLETVLGTSTDTEETTIFGKLNSVEESITAINGSSSSVDSVLNKWGSYSASDIYDKVKTLSSEISAINAISKTDSLIIVNANQSEDLLALKNSLLAMRAILDTNRMLLEKTSNKPIIKTWLEEGSIIFKTLITNPSTTSSQTVPLEYYLPKELTQEDIITIDPNLKVSYDSEKETLLVSGEFSLEPQESKTIAIETTDIWQISDTELDSLAQQAQTLIKATEKTSYFAQASILYSDIEVALAKVRELKKESYTPEARIRAYRQAEIELMGTRKKIEDLKTLTSQAGSLQTLTGFVGGVQTMAVWGMIVVMVIGFVALALYIRTLSGKQAFASPTPKKQIVEHVHITPPTFSTSIKPGMVTVGALVLFLGVVTYLGSRFLAIKLEVLPKHTSGKTAQTTISTQTKLVASPSAQASQLNLPAEKTGEPQILGESTQSVYVINATNDNRVNVRKVEKIYTPPSLDTPVLAVLTEPTQVEIIKKLESWFLVDLMDYASTSGNLHGWVYADYIQIAND